MLSRSAPELHGERPPLPGRIQIVTWTRVGLVYGCLEGALWSPHAWRGWWSLAAAGLIAGILLADLAHGVLHVRDLGIGLRGLTRGWWIPLAAALLAGSIVLAGWRANTLHGLFGPAAAPAHAAGYAIWTVVQEFIAQSFFFLQLLRVLKPRQAVIANGLLFGAAHWPNPVLVPVTLAGGWFLTACFARIRNIYPLAMAHTLIALSLAVSVPDHIHRHMRVGIGYEHYQPHRMPSLSLPPSWRSR
jgi:membrane protease YdiL (CAAX protease family)